MSDIKRGLDILKKYVRTAPEKPGVYRMIAKDGEVLYVGKAKNIKKRIVWYTKFEKLPTRLKRMVALVDKMEFIITPNEAGALLTENELIKRYLPKFNILLKDDKSFPYLAFDKNEEYPALFKYRGKKQKGFKYFGPFADVSALKNTIDTIQKVFQIRTCKNDVFKNRQRPCLLYQIKRCLGPCGQMISKEDYRKSLHNMSLFLEGKSTDIKELLKKEMQEASNNLEFEKAIAIREKIKALSAVTEQGVVSCSGLKSTDVIGLYRHENFAALQIFFYRFGKNFGNTSFFLNQNPDDSSSDIIEAFISNFYLNHETPDEILVPNVLENKEFLEKALNVKIETFQKGNKAKLIEQANVNAKACYERKQSENASVKENLMLMKEVFDLPQIPQRIEIYDNSHNQGSYAVGAMVVATPSGFDKKSYRTFNICQEKNTNDDFAMMREVLRRRFAHMSTDNKPDVILLDGGRGQLNAVYEALADFDLSSVCIIAISKGPERNAGKEFYHIRNKESFALEYRSKLAFYMQTLRDEAHRFAIGTHRKKRAKSIYKSVLDDIEGIGAKRKKELLLFFGSKEAVKDASLEDLQKVTGIYKKTAEKIYKYFHK